MECERHTGECWGTDPGEVHRGTGGGHGEGPRATSVKVFGTDKAQLEEPRVGLGGGLLSQGGRLPSRPSPLWVHSVASVNCS